MFGLEAEAITLLASTGVSFVMKFMAQKNANQQKLLEMSIQRSAHQNVLQNDAAKRGTPWVRKFISITVISTTFLGLIWAAQTGTPVIMINEIPKNEFLWGLIKWGKTHEIISSNGFVLPEYAKQITMMIAGFFYGSSFNKTY